MRSGHSASPSRCKIYGPASKAIRPYRRREQITPPPSTALFGIVGRFHFDCATLRPGASSKPSRVNGKGRGSRASHQTETFALPKYQTSLTSIAVTAVFRSPRRTRPICSSSQTDFMMRSRLIAGVPGYLLTYPARYASEAVSMPSRAQTR